MSEVERYWIDPNRLVQEGWHQDDTCVVNDWAYERIVAERDALRNEVGRVKGEYDRAVNKVDALQRLLTAADEQVDRLNRVAHLAAADSAALQKRVHALTEALDQIYGWCGAFLDDDIDMPKASVKALRDITAKALPIHGKLLETP